MKQFIFSVLFACLFFQASQANAKVNFDLTFNIGPSLNQSDGMDDLGDPNLSTGFGFNVFFNPNHGVGLGYNNESSYDGSKKHPGIKDASFSTFDLHYVYRHIWDKVHLVFEPGIGRQTLYDEATDYYWGYTYSDDLSTAFLVNYKIFLRYVVANLSGENDDVSNNFFVGVGLIHNFSFDDSLNGQDISGNRLAALFQIGLGW